MTLAVSANQRGLKPQFERSALVLSTKAKTTGHERSRRDSLRNALSFSQFSFNLGSALAPPVILPDGGKDLYIQWDKFHDQFAADVPVAETELMACTQRPVTEAALNEDSGAAAWKSIPSWFIYGDRDLNIPAAALSFMAERANSNETVAVAGASHVVMISHPDAVAEVIEHAAT